MVERKNIIRLLYTDLLKEEECFIHYYQMMPPDRREKINRFRFDKDKRLSLAAGILLEKGLREYAVCHERSFRDRSIFINPYGKPYYEDPGDFHFNLSHSGQVAAAAFSDRPVGLDLEENRHFEEKLIRHVFLQEEISMIQSEDGNPDIWYTRMWTIKESVMKYFGKGLSLDPGKIRIERMSADPHQSGKYQVRAMIADPDDKSLDRQEGEEIRKDFYISSWDLSGYQLSVCSGYGDFTGQPEWVTRL